MTTGYYYVKAKVKSQKTYYGVFPTLQSCRFHCLQDMHLSFPHSWLIRNRYLKAYQLFCYIIVNNNGARVNKLSLFRRD